MISPGVIATTRRWAAALIVLLLALVVTEDLRGQTPAVEFQANEAQLEEYQRPLRVAILPFAAEDGEPLRTAPLVESLPLVIRERLSRGPGRLLSAADQQAYTEALSFDPEGTLDPPEFRNLVIEPVSFPGSHLKALFHRSVRAYLEKGDAIDAGLLLALAEQTSADLFISGSVFVREQYVIFELLLISPAEAVFGRGAVIHSQRIGIRSIEALSSIGEYIETDLGKALYNGPAGSISVEWTDDLPSRVYLDGQYRGNRPDFIHIVPEGEHLLEIYRGVDRVFNRQIGVSDGQVTPVSFVPPDETPDWLMISTVPQGLSVFADSSFLGFTPLRVRRPENPEYLQLQGFGVGQWYILIDSQTPDFTRYQIPPDVVDWRGQMERDRRDFYRSLGFTLVSAIVPLVSNGISRNYLASDFSAINAEEFTRLDRTVKITQSVTVTGLLVTLLGLADTVEQLFRYLETAERARGVINAP